MVKRVQYSPEEQANFTQTESGVTQHHEPQTNFEYIKQELSTKESTSRIALSLGFKAKDEAGKSEAFKYISSVLQEIKKTEGDDKKDLTVCSVDSIIGAMIDSANFKLPIDGRQLAHLVRYKMGNGYVAQFQPGYKGFIYKIAEFYNCVDFTAEPVFDGDTLELTDEGGFQSYTHKRADPWIRDQKKMLGLIACLTYTDAAGQHSKVALLPKAEIDQIRKVAKQDFIWSAWYFEKAKVAALKRLCKYNFATVLGLQELVQWDNENNFNIDVTPHGDRIALGEGGAADLAKQLENKPEVPINVTVKTEEKEKVV